VSNKMEFPPPPLDLYCWGRFYEDCSQYNVNMPLTPAIMLDGGSVAGQIVEKMKKESRIVRSIYFNHLARVTADEMISLLHVRPKYIRQLAFFCANLQSGAGTASKVHKSIEALVNLQSLYIDRNVHWIEVRDLFKLLPNFPRLQKLSLLNAIPTAEDMALGSILAEYCPRLVVLNISVSFNCPGFLKDISRLKHLTAVTFLDYWIRSFSEEMNDALFEFISNARSLESLKISFGKCKDPNIPLVPVGYIIMPSKLRNIWLENSESYDPSESVVKQWEFNPELESLNLAQIRFGENVFTGLASGLSGHAKLSRLSMNLNNLQAHFILVSSCLETLPNLTYLTLEGIYFSKNAIFEEFNRNVIFSPNIEVLSLGKMTWYDSSWQISTLVSWISQMEIGKFKLLKVSFPKDVLFGLEKVVESVSFKVALEKNNLTLTQFDPLGKEFEPIWRRNKSRQRFLSRASLLRALDNIPGYLKDFHLVRVIFQLLPEDCWPNVERINDDAIAQVVSDETKQPEHIQNLLNNANREQESDDELMFSDPSNIQGVLEGQQDPHERDSFSKNAERLSNAGPDQPQSDVQITRNSTSTPSPDRNCILM
jgi:hypothetical protein